MLLGLKFAEHLKEAVSYIEQGRVRVGPEMDTDPAFLVTKEYGRLRYMGCYVQDQEKGARVQ